MLTITVSTRSSGSVILDERRVCLTPDMMIILITVKDEGLAKQRNQHTLVEQELIVAFQNVYLDVIPPKKML